MSNYSDRDLHEVERAYVESGRVLHRAGMGEALADHEVVLLKRVTDAVRVLLREVRERRADQDVAEVAARMGVEADPTLALARLLAGLPAVEVERGVEQPTGFPVDVARIEGWQAAQYPHNGSIEGLRWFAAAAPALLQARLEDEAHKGTAA